MSQKITRKAPNARKVAAAQGTARKVRSAKAKTGSALDRTLAALPFSEETLHRIVLCIILGGALVLAWMMATLAGVPAIAGRQIAIFAGDAGFEVRRVDVRGVKYAKALENDVVGHGAVPLGQDERVGAAYGLVDAVVEHGVDELEAGEGRRHVEGVDVLRNLENAPPLVAAPARGLRLLLRGQSARHLTPSARSAARSCR